MTEDIMERIDLEAAENLASSLLGEEKVSMRQLMESLLQGDFKGTLMQLKGCMAAWLFPGILEGKKLLVSLLLILFAIVFVHYLTLVLKNRQVSMITYDVLYLLVVLLLLYTFDNLYRTGQESIVQVKDFMTVLIPAYSLSMAMSAGTVSAAANYELLVLLLLGIDYMMLKLFLPMTRSCFLIAMMNGLDEHGRMRQLWRLLVRIVSWGMKLCLSLTIAVSSLGNLVAGGSDGMQRTLVRKAISVIPGIGDLGDSVTELFLTSAALIRSCIGVAAIIILFLLLLRPAWVTFCLCFCVRLTGVCASLLGLDRMARTLTEASESGMQLLKIHLCTFLLFSVVLAATMHVRV